MTEADTSELNIEREKLHTDILIVGGGPAGLSLAYHLSSLVSNSSGMEMPEIIVMEKGSYVGAHSLSGAVMDPRALAELIPDFVERGAPLESKVSDDTFYFLSEASAIRAPFLPPPLRNHGNYVISLNKFSSWLGEQVEAAGVDIYSGLAGFDLLIEDETVVGVRTVDMGLDHHGKAKSNFEPGSEIKAKVTILCEGVHGSLTRIAFEKLPALRENCLPQSYLTGVKEVWEVAPGRIKAGEVIHTVGWPQPNRDYGGGWVYGMSDTMVSVGYAIGLDSPDPTNDPHGLFQRYKTHKHIRAILEGGKMLHYGAKAIPVGGFYSIPKLTAKGLMLCGDSAGMLNPSRLKGIHTAIKTGMMAAETLFDAVQKKDYSEIMLVGYEEKFGQSWVRDELYSSRNFHAGFKGGLIAGLFHASMQMISGGAGLFDRRKHESDHKKMLTVAEYRSNYGRDPGKDKVSTDNSYTFDKVSDVYKSGTMHEENQPSHLVIADYDICNTRCTKEYGNPCQHFCPANVYNMVDDSDNPGKIKLQLTPSNCVHCKTCDIADPYQVIRWVTPQGGEGPNYTNL